MPILTGAGVALSEKTRYNSRSGGGTGNSVSTGHEGVSKKRNKVRKQRQKLPKDTVGNVPDWVLWALSVIRVYLHVKHCRQLYVTLLIFLSCVICVWSIPRSDRVNFLLRLADIVASCIKSAYVLVCFIICLTLVIAGLITIIVAAVKTIKMFGYASLPELDRRYRVFMALRDIEEQDTKEETMNPETAAYTLFTLICMSVFFLIADWLYCKTLRVFWLSLIVHKLWELENRLDTIPDVPKLEKDAVRWRIYSILEIIRFADIGVGLVQLVWEKVTNRASLTVRWDSEVSGLGGTVCYNNRLSRHPFTSYPTMSQKQ